MKRLVSALVATLALAVPALRPAAFTILAILVIVTVHEAGHFFVARWFKVGTPEFATGFGPVLFERTRNNVRYTLRAIPLGGFVRIQGMSNSSLDSDTTPESPAPAEPGRSWNDVSPFARVAISVAGPAANFLLALVLLAVVVVAVGKPANSLPYVKPAADTAPAAAAGIEPADLVTNIAGTPVASMDELRSALAAHLAETIDATGSTPSELAVPVTVLRDGQVEKLVVVATVLTTELGPTARLGVLWDPPRAGLSASEALDRTTDTYGQLVSQTVRSFASIASSVWAVPAQFLGQGDDTKRFISPIGAAQLGADAQSRDGWVGPVTLAALASMSIGAFNLLPLPPLDGGNTVIALYEGVASRLRRRQVRVDPARFAPLVRVVTVVLLLLGVSSLALDVLRPIALP
jgi:membrane-associated protease RseP (regulator of RpoE activity)